MPFLWQQGFDSKLCFRSQSVPRLNVCCAQHLWSVRQKKKTVLDYNEGNSLEHLDNTCRSTILFYFNACLINFMFTGFPLQSATSDTVEFRCRAVVNVNWCWTYSEFCEVTLDIASGLLKLIDCIFCGEHGDRFLRIAVTLWRTFPWSRNSVLCFGTPEIQ